ncbi:MAG: peptide deformylase [Planctomycetia bacterium]|nr:peptide deformylase [Planctomycetia bacterium]
MLQIVKYPHPALCQKCYPLRKVDAELKEMIGEMFQLMYSHKGVGLAANQVGLPYRFFIMNPTGKEENKEEEYVFINPEITRGSGKPITDEEGCLSFPEIYFETIRSPKVTIRAYNLRGEEVTYKWDGFPARIVQHEYDHLDGVSFFLRAAEEDWDIIDQIEKLKKTFQQQQAEGTIADNETLQKELQRLAELRAML